MTVTAFLPNGQRVRGRLDSFDEHGRVVIDGRMYENVIVVTEGKRKP